MLDSKAICSDLLTGRVAIFAEDEVAFREMINSIFDMMESGEDRIHTFSGRNHWMDYWDDRDDSITYVVCREGYLRHGSRIGGLSVGRYKTINVTQYETEEELPDSEVSVDYLL